MSKFEDLELPTTTTIGDRTNSDCLLKRLNFYDYYMMVINQKINHYFQEDF